MISKLSEYLAKKLIAGGTIKEEDRELYTYGLFMLLSQAMFFIIACLFGLLLGCILESIIFYIAFQFIRKYAGGYHAATETRCSIISTLSILACIIVIRLSKTYDFQIALLVGSAISAVCIFFFCPLDTPEKPLTDKEFRYFRRISRILLLVLVSAVVISCLFSCSAVLVPCCMSLILEGILISAGKAKRIHTAKAK